jgi:hypothetical protein
MTPQQTQSDESNRPASESWRTLPALLSAEQVAGLLGVNSTYISTVVAAGVLTPLGDPSPQSVKYFSRADVLVVCEDKNALEAVVRAIYERNRGKSA